MNLSGKKIRIKDIATLAGVSPGTVDRVIHNRGQVTEENRIKILKIIDELDYKPNLVARSLANKKNYLFASLCPEYKTPNDYWKAPDDGIDRAAREINDYNITVKKFFFDQFSVKTFVKEIENIQKINPDGVLLSPVFRKETMDFVEELEKKQVPYIFLDSNIEGLNNISYLGQNSFQSGFLAARLLHYTIPENSAVLILRIGGSETSNQSIHRQEGIEEFFKSTGQKHKLVHLDLDPEKNDSIKRFEASVKQNDFKGMIVINSKAFEIASYLEKLSLAGINLIGYDLLPENIRFLKKGIISFLIAQRPEYQGYKGILSLFDHIVLKVKLEKNNYLPIDILTSENIDYYLNYI
jgi:LacI family transcriptional regulator